jgi:alginate O-acetyltransferase complex protein AlgI
VSWTIRKVNLLIVSYVFYSAWNPPYVIIIWLSTVIDWTIAKAMFASRKETVRRLLLVATLLINLGVLATFKYANFITENLNELFGLVGIRFHVPQTDLILPIGISFYTFQSLSYTIDVYRGHLRPPRTMLDYALLVAFFPQLVAGPIIRAARFLPQLLTPKKVDIRAIGWGATLITIGLFEKVVLSDYLLAPIADSVFERSTRLSPADAWAGMLAFSGQIFCDFSGYSLCAIGAACCLGFKIAENFHFPYAAAGFSDFWQRWHISLSSWLRDYLYIGLGGNRDGVVKTYRNLMLTMLIGGLWHGASWCFVFWGVLHGAFLVVERLLKAWGWQVERESRFVLYLSMLTTFVLVTMAWVFFRSRTLAEAFDMLSAAFAMSPAVPSQLTVASKGTALALMGVLVLGQWFLRDTSLQQAIARAPAVFRVITWAFMIAAILLAGGDSRAFIYFQF